MSHGGAFLHRAHRVFIHERVEKKVHCWRNRTRCCRRNRTRCCRRLAFSAQALRIILAKLAFWRQKSLLASRTKKPARLQTRDKNRFSFCRDRLQH